MYNARTATTAASSSSSSSSSTSASASSRAALDQIAAPDTRIAQDVDAQRKTEVSSYDDSVSRERAAQNAVAATEIARRLIRDPEICNKAYVVACSVVADLLGQPPQSDATNSLASSNFSSVEDLNEFVTDDSLVTAPSSPNNYRALLSRASSPISDYGSVDSDVYDAAPDFINNSGVIIEEISSQSSAHSSSSPPRLNNINRPPFEAVLQHYRRLQYPATRVLLHPPMGIVGMFASRQNHPNSLPIARRVMFRAALFNQSINNSNINHSGEALEQPAQAQQLPEQDPFEVPNAEPGVIKQIVEKLYRMINGVYEQLFRSDAVIAEQEPQHGHAHAVPMSDDARHRRNIRRQKHEEKRRKAESVFENNVRNATLAGLLVLSGAMFYRLIRVTDPQVAMSFKREFWVAFFNNMPSLFQPVN